MKSEYWRFAEQSEREQREKLRLKRNKKELVDIIAKALSEKYTLDPMDSVAHNDNARRAIRYQAGECGLQAYQIEIFIQHFNEEWLK